MTGFFSKAVTTTKKLKRDEWHGWKKPGFFTKKKTYPLGFFNKTRVLLFFWGGGVFGLYGFFEKKKIKKFYIEI